MCFRRVLEKGGGVLYHTLGSGQCCAGSRTRGGIRWGAAAPPVVSGRWSLIGPSCDWSREARGRHGATDRPGLDLWPSTGPYQAEAGEPLVPPSRTRAPGFKGTPGAGCVRRMPHSPTSGSKVTKSLRPAASIKPQRVSLYRRKSFSTYGSKEAPPVGRY